MSTLTFAQLEQLETEGYTVVPGYLDTAETARLREHIDSLLPPVADGNDEEDRRVRELRHPIPGEIMPGLIAEGTVELARQLLYKADDEGLRLLEQVLIRTDPAPFSKRTQKGATGWHVDMPFLRRHYDARPRQTYFHMVHALSSVASGGGAFMVVPGSHLKNFKAAARYEEEQLKDFQKELHADPRGAAGVDLTEAIEVLPGDGDLLIFNPMCLHSASTNVTEQPRYVYFASFCDASADYLMAELGRTGYRSHFPQWLRDGLPENRRVLLDA